MQMTLSFILPENQFDSCCSVEAGGGGGGGGGGAGGDPLWFPMQYPE